MAGSLARVRIAQETAATAAPEHPAGPDTILTDFGTLDVVSSSIAVP
jgi:hypothetical protein